MRKVSELHVYPVKSCRGRELSEASVVATGFERDREWMVIDEDGYFMSQRQLSLMATIAVDISADSLTLSAPGISPISVPIVAGFKRKAVVWESKCEVDDQGDSAAKWLSSYLGKQVRLARMADESSRLLKSKYQIDGTQTVAFADSMPFLLTSQSSLTDLNSKLAAPLPMDRFRPNIVFSGGDAFEEDAWKRVRIGNVVFRAAKACTRCEITTIDQTTGEKGSEPLETLGRYRTGPKGIMFGLLLIHEHEGVVRLGDAVEILE